MSTRAPRDGGLDFQPHDYLHEGYGPFSKLGERDPHFGRKISFVNGKFAGLRGTYLEKVNVMHRVVVYLGSGCGGQVRCVWAHSFRICGYHLTYVTMEEIERDTVVMDEERRVAIGLSPPPSIPDRRGSMSLDPEDRLVNEICALMDQVGWDESLPAHIVRKVNRRRG